MSYHVISCHVMPYHVIWCRVVSWTGLLVDKSCRVGVCCSCHVVSWSGLVCCTVRCYNRNKHLVSGLTAFDFISDFEEWIDCGYFSEEIKARLKGSVVYKVFLRTMSRKKLTSWSPLTAYSLKHARDLVRAITKKVKGQVPSTSHAQTRNPQHALPASGQVPMMLPPITRGRVK